MKKILIVIICVYVSCKKEKNYNVDKLVLKENITKKPIEGLNTILPIDKIFKGEYKISDKTYIRNLSEGGENYQYFDEYENLLSLNNKIFGSWKTNEFKTFKIDNFSLQLKRLKFKKSENKKDIQIMLYTQINGINKDSIMFYKYQIDKIQSFYPDQRHEILTNINDQLIIHHLETITNQSEFALTIEKWSKLLVNKKTGKIGITTENIEFNN